MKAPRYPPDRSTYSMSIPVSALKLDQSGGAMVGRPNPRKTINFSAALDLTITDNAGTEAARMPDPASLRTLRRVDLRPSNFVIHRPPSCRVDQNGSIGHSRIGCHNRAVLFAPPDAVRFTIRFHPLPYSGGNSADRGLDQMIEVLPLV